MVSVRLGTKLIHVDVKSKILSLPKKKIENLIKGTCSVLKYNVRESEEGSILRPTKKEM